jgi:hypothetical protein
MNVQKLDPKNTDIDQPDNQFDELMKKYGRFYSLKKA